MPVATRKDKSSSRHHAPRKAAGNVHASALLPTTDDRQPTAVLPPSETQIPKAKAAEPPPPSTPQEACRRAMDAIVASFPGIVNAQILKANEGSPQHAKFLCEFAGLSGALVSPAAAADDSFARLLLDRLQIGNEDSGAAPDEPSSVP